MSDYYLVDFEQKGDERGHLVVAESGSTIPFDIKRIFYIYGSTENVVRGKHANRNSKFLFINLSGSCKIKVDNGKGKIDVFNLDKPHIGLYLSNMLWKEMYEFSEDSVLLVLSNNYYDENEYIRNYDDFLNEVQDI